MMNKRFRRRLGAVLPALLILFTISAALPVGAVAGLPAGIKSSIRTWEPEADPPSPRMPRLLSDGPEAGEDGEGDDVPGKSKIVGYSLLVSGVGLCAWGISAWEVEEYQCCPARNTGNVVKIVGGVILLNAGLIYLLGGND